MGLPSSAPPCGSCVCNTSQSKILQRRPVRPALPPGHEAFSRLKPRVMWDKVKARVLSDGLIVSWTTWWLSWAVLPEAGCSYVRCPQSASAAANNITKESEVRAFEGSCQTRTIWSKQNTASSDGEWHCMERKHYKQLFWHMVVRFTMQLSKVTQFSVNTKSF